MIRRIIRIDKEKCNGCGACADACHEGAIDIINGKAELVREHFCDGLGDCLPECPTGAISFEEREAPEYDEEAVKEAQKKISAKNQAISAHTGCPGSRSCRSSGQKHPKQINHLQQDLRYQGSGTGRYRSNWRPFMRPILAVRSF